MVQVHNGRFSRVSEEFRMNVVAFLLVSFLHFDWDKKFIEPPFERMKSFGTKAVFAAPR
jgi:hypothetical protein